MHKISSNLEAQIRNRLLSMCDEKQALAALWRRSPRPGIQQFDGPFRVRLLSFGDKKINVIKAVRMVDRALGLKEAKDLVESAPCMLADGCDRDRAEQYRQELAACGEGVIFEIDPDPGIATRDTRSIVAFSDVLGDAERDLHERRLHAALAAFDVDRATEFYIRVGDFTISAEETSGQTILLCYRSGSTFAKGSRRVAQRRAKLIAKEIEREEADMQGSEP